MTHVPMPGPRFSRLKACLLAEFNPDYLDITDESHMHAGPHLETHFKIVLVSATFENLRRVQRHQAVYQQLAVEMQQGLHAAGLHLYSPAEWAKTMQAPASPQCRGGDKNKPSQSHN